MKKLDQNQKVGLFALVIFCAFLIGFSVLGTLAQGGRIPNFTICQRVQGVLAFLTYLPLCIAMFFEGRHFKSKGNKVGAALRVAAIAFLAYGILQMILSFLGVYGYMGA